MSKAELEDDDVKVMGVDPEAETDLDEELDTEAAKAEPDETEGEEELVVTIGEATPASEDEDTERAPAWVREVRKQNRELARQNRELQAFKAQVEQRAEPQLGPKPTLESVGYDTDKYERALDDWKERKAAADRKRNEQLEAQQREQQRWQSEIDSYKTQKDALKVKDFDDAEEVVTAALSQTQIGIIVDGAQNKALVMYALGRNEQALADLAKITNPVKFAFAVARMETQMKTTTRKPAVSPEKTITGSAPASGRGSDATLARLEAEAERTGDRTKIVAYKRQLKERASK